MAEKLYLYLTRRDKMGMKLISVLPAPKSVPPTRISGIDGMNLPTNLSEEITGTIERERMLFEPWIETASSFQDLRDSLKRRGYKNIPNHISPLHEARGSLDQRPVPKTKHISKRKTMLRRASKPS